MHPYFTWWPRYNPYRVIDVYRLMEGLVAAGLVKTLGVSNFSARKMIHLLQGTSIKPVLAQLELHPGFPQQDLVDFLKKELRIFPQSVSCSGIPSPMFMTPSRVVLQTLPLGDQDAAKLDPTIIDYDEDPSLQAIVKAKSLTRDQVSCPQPGVYRLNSEHLPFPKVLVSWSLSSGLGALPQICSPTKALELLGTLRSRRTRDEMGMLGLCDRQSYFVRIKKGKERTVPGQHWFYLWDEDYEGDIPSNA